MHLRRVEVHGFKSFADRQRFEFGPGMTVVVGPNGSGKSNVSDAIRWALGEQSGRSIRARKTEDVIFSGSDKRRPMGLAEVTLTLDNSEGWMPIDYAEVTVTRRAHRSGESEYLINGQKVRLMDVQELFRRAQVGQNSYAMMSQGLVDEVLALRPVERRDLIEEAADVHRHRIELQRAERRLTETRDNLGHVRMLIREVEPRLRQLERQTTRAERFRTLNGELSEVLQVYYEHELRQTQEALTAARARHDQRTQQFASARSALEVVVTHADAVERLAGERRAVLDHAQSVERALAEEGLRLQQGVALAEQRSELLAVRAEEVAGEIEAAPPIAMPEELADGATAERLMVAATTLEREREALRSADEAARALLRTLAETEARRTRLEGELSDAERRITAATAASAQRATARAEAELTRTAVHDRLRAYGQRALALHREGGLLATASENARRRRDHAERQLEEELRLAVEANDALRGATSAAEALAERHAMLTALAEQSMDASSAAQALLAASREPGEDGQPLLHGIVGVVTHLLRVPDGLERAIEAALAEQISAIVVEHEADAIAAVEYLQEHGGGALTVLPLDTLAHNYPLNLFNERGVIGVAARLVRVEPEYRALIDTLLGRTIVVDSLAVAREMVQRGLGSVVTRDGVLLRAGGAIYGGRGGGAEQLRVQRALASAPAAIAEARVLEAEASARFQRAEPAVVAGREAVAQARHAVDAADELRRAHEQARAHLRRELVAMSADLSLAQAALAPHIEAEDPTLRERPAALRAALAAIAEEITTLQARTELLGAERDATAEHVATSAAAVAAAEGERDAQQSQRVQRADERRLALERREQRLTLLAEVRREREDIALSLRDLRERLANNRTALTEAEQAVAPAHALLADVLGEQRELGATRGDAQTVLFGAERETLTADAELRQSAHTVQTLLSQIADEGLAAQPDGSVRPVPTTPDQQTPTSEYDEHHLEAAYASAVSAPASGGAEVDIVALRTRISDLRAEIRALGPVNIDALDDLSEERDRHRFLSGQVLDLESAEVELRGAIRDLDRLIRTRFDETFALVNANFRDYFHTFFGGGTAELRIVEPESEDGEAGVDIFAQPPGKRVTSLSVLSGGERALTSVALLFALLAVNPAPVCIMDEVDAALDEANVGRFIETLMQLTARSQFIVITHNRRTVEAADTIYGVSMGEESTSQVLSLSVADLPRAS